MRKNQKAVTAGNVGCLGLSSLDTTADVANTLLDASVEGEEGSSQVFIDYPTLPLPFSPTLSFRFPPFFSLITHQLTSSAMYAFTGLFQHVSSQNHRYCIWSEYAWCLGSEEENFCGEGVVNFKLLDSSSSFSRGCDNLKGDSRCLRRSDPLRLHPRCSRLRLLQLVSFASARLSAS